MSFDFGDVGNDIWGGINNAASSVGNFFTNTVPSALGFSGGDAAAPSADTGIGASVSPTTFSAPSSSASPATPPAGGSFTPSQISSFMTGGSAPPGSTTSASSFADPNNGAGNTNSVLSTANTPTPPSTMSQIMSALGLGSASTGDLLKGALGAGGLAYSVAKNSGSNPAEKQIEAQAQQTGQQGQQLESYLANGTLPPGAQSFVDQQTAAQKAAIRSKYAANGGTGSTSEVQELNNVDSQATAQMFELATQLYNTGVTQTGASSQLYNLLMNAQNSSNEQVGTAISNFTSALGGGGSGQTFQITPKG